MAAVLRIVRSAQVDYLDGFEEMLEASFPASSRTGPTPVENPFRVFVETTSPCNRLSLQVICRKTEVLRHFLQAQKGTSYMVLMKC